MCSKSWGYNWLPCNNGWPDTLDLQECLLHLTRISQQKKFLSKESLAQLIYAFVISRLDYCNCLLASLLKASLDRLQRVQNAVPRLLHGAKKFAQSTPFSLTCIGSPLYLELAIRLPCLLIVVWMFSPLHIFTPFFPYLSLLVWRVIDL